MMAGTTKANALATAIALKTGKEPSQSQMSSIGSSVITSLNEMADLAKAKMATQTLRELSSPEQKSATGEIASVVSIAKDLAGIDDSRQRSLREEAVNERDHRRAIEDKLHAVASQGEGAMVQMLQAMMQQTNELNNRWQDRLLQEQRQHREDLQRLEERLAAKKTEEEANKPGGNLINEIMQQLLMDRLNSQAPSAVQQIQEAKQLASLVTPPPAAPSGQSERAVELQFELAKMKLEHERELKREELDSQSIAMDRRTKMWEGIASNLGQIMNFIGQQSGRGAAGPAAQATGTAGMPPQEDNAPIFHFKCTNEQCGREFNSKNKTQDPPCPVCGEPMDMVGRVQ